MARGKEEQKALTTVRCNLCWSKDQISQHIHFLQLGDGLGGHLREQYGEDQSGLIGGIVDWVRTIQRLYDDRVDDAGNPLPAWRAWILAHRLGGSMVRA